MALDDYTAIKPPILAGPDCYHVYLGHCDTHHRDVVRQFLTGRGFSCYDGKPELSECEAGINGSRNVVLFLTPASSTRQSEETDLEARERHLALEKVELRGERSVTLVLSEVEDSAIPRRLRSLTSFSTEGDTPQQTLEALQLSLVQGQCPCSPLYHPSFPPKAVYHVHIHVQPIIKEHDYNGIPIFNIFEQTYQGVLLMEWQS